jgi:hypothetical protein
LIIPEERTNMPQKAASRTNHPTNSFDRIATTCAALIIVCLAVFLLIRNQPIADPRLFLVMRVIISFSAAALGATIPGFLHLGWHGQGLAIRAGGALALFVLTFVYTPDLVTGQGNSEPRIKQESMGTLSPNIIGNTGNIQINSGNGQKKP